MAEPADDRSRLAAIGEIAAEIAHELRNTLQLITNHVFLAQHDPSATAAHLERIGRNARAAQTIVDDVLALARGVDADERVALAEVLSLAREELRAELVDELPANLTVRGHAGLLTRLFHVLYENAVLASAPRAPRIHTRASLEDGQVVVLVEDDGPGVPAALAERIFEPLVTARPGGTGLGLALAQRIVAAHGGSLSLASSTPAVFRITLSP